MAYPRVSSSASSSHRPPPTPWMVYAIHRGGGLRLCPPVAPHVPCPTPRRCVALGLPCGTMSITVAVPWSRDVNHPGDLDHHLSHLWSHAWMRASIHQPLPSCAVPSRCTLLRSMYYDGACSYTLHLMMCTIYVLRTPIPGKPSRVLDPEGLQSLACWCSAPRWSATTSEPTYGPWP